MNEADSIRAPITTESLKQLLRAGVPIKTILDVGVLKGTPALMRAFPDHKHWLFEPVDTHFDCIHANYASIQHELCHVAASNCDAQAWQVGVSNNGSGDITHSYLSAEKVALGERVVSCDPIDAVRLDTYLKGKSVEPPYLLKVDVDGTELNVLDGCAGILDEISVMVVEAPKHKLVERASYVESKGFALFDIVELTYYDNVFWQSDLIFVRNELVASIDALNPMRTKKTFEPSKYYELSSAYLKNR